MVVGLFGLDLAIDGEVDMLHGVAAGLSSLFGTGGTTAASMLVPAAALVATASAVGLMHAAVRSGEKAWAYTANSLPIPTPSHSMNASWPASIKRSIKRASSWTTGSRPFSATTSHSPWCSEPRRRLRTWNGSSAA